MFILIRFFRKKLVHQLLYLGNLAVAFILSAGGGLLADSPPLLQATGTIVTDQGPLTDEQFYEALERGGSVRITAAGSVLLTRTIIITNNAVLDATHHDFTLDGGGRFRVFRVLKEGSLTLSNVTVVRGYAKEELATEEGTADDALGGAILSDGGNVKLIACKFLNNRAEGSQGSGKVNGANAPGASARGGAVFNNLGALTAIQCRFESNTVVGGREGPLSTSSTSHGGHASGGAVGGLNGSMIFSNCVFVRNQCMGGPGTSLDPDLGYRGSSRGGALHQNGNSTLISDCTFQGNTVANGGPAAGGGIFQEGGSLFMVRTTVATNTVFGAPPGGKYGLGFPAHGGGIFSIGSLTMDECRLIGNAARSSSSVNAFGGGLHSGGTAVIHASLVEGNVSAGGNGFTIFVVGAVTPNGTGLGGGIFNTGQLNVVRSAVVGNITKGGQDRGLLGFGGDALGGGLYTSNSAYIENSTFARNDTVAGNGILSDRGPANAVGGGIYNVNGLLTMNHVTVAGNAARSGTNYNYSNHGDIQVGWGVGAGLCAGTNGTVILQNSIVADNQRGTNVYGSVIDGGGNLCSDGSAQFSRSLNNTDPMLGQLSGSDGELPTIPLLPGSPAIDGGSITNCTPTDQRGVVRPFGGGCDIGAYESNAALQDTDLDGLGDGWERGFGRYEIIPGLFTWSEAKADAELRGGHLATVIGATEWADLREVLGTQLNGKNLWLGGTDEGTEGHWRWITGEKWSFSHWRINEPGNDSVGDGHGDPENYLMIWGNETETLDNQQAFWNDAPATGGVLARDGYILERGSWTDPNNPDTDGDGLSDRQETKPRVGVQPTDPNNPDSDGDGYNDGVEVSSGSDPLNGTSSPEILELRVVVELTFGSTAGRSYRIQTSSDLRTWRDFGEPFIGTGIKTKQLVELHGTVAYWRLVRLE